MTKDQGIPPVAPRGGQGGGPLVIGHWPLVLRNRRDAGFSLIEVMLALAILAMAVVVVLDQRVDVVREAAAARDARTTWMLASRKMAELELDTKLWAGQGGSGNGDFAELDGEYAGFTWEYLAVREPVETVDPALVKPGEKPKEIFRVTLGVRAPGLEPMILEAQVPVFEAPAADAEAPQNGQPPGTPGETPPPPPGPKK